MEQKEGFINEQGKNSAYVAGIAGSFEPSILRICDVDVLGERTWIRNYGKEEYTSERIGRIFSSSRSSRDGHPISAKIKRERRSSLAFL
jgi:hypothetical protein